VTLRVLVPSWRSSDRLPESDLLDVERKIDGGEPRADGLKADS